MAPVCARTELCNILAIALRGGGLRMSKQRLMQKWRVLDNKVIAVASQGWVGDWAAYIGAVEGRDHEGEWFLVMEYGTKLPQDIAEALFPEFKMLHWRD